MNTIFMLKFMTCFGYFPHTMHDFRATVCCCYHVLNSLALSYACSVNVMAIHSELQDICNMAAKKDIEKKVKLREFQRSVNQLLSTEDRDYLFYALREYNTYKSVAKLMLALNSCLDTPEKLDLLPYVRDLIPKHDKKKFDSLAPYNRMAHPLALQMEQGRGTTGTATTPGETAKSYTRASTRVVNLQRPSGTPLGFSIRGGVEHNLGIYLSHVDSFSLAEKSGLKVGDQIVNVNGIDFNRVSHSSAVLVLKSHDNLRIEVKNTGIMPGQKMDRNSILW